MDYHKNRFEDASLLVFKKNKLIALFPANHNKDIVYSHQGLTYGGLLTSEMVKLIDVIECFKVILHFYETIGYSAVEIKLLPSIYSIEPNDEM